MGAEIPSSYISASSLCKLYEGIYIYGIYLHVYQWLPLCCARLLALRAGTQHRHQPPRKSGRCILDALQRAASMVNLPNVVSEMMPDLSTMSDTELLERRKVAIEIVQREGLPEIIKLTREGNDAQKEKACETVRIPCHPHHTHHSRSVLNHINMCCVPLCSSHTSRHTMHSVQHASCPWEPFRQL